MSSASLDLQNRFHLQARKAFRGELVPQDPNDEPVSVSLVRIRAEREVRLSTRRSSIKKK
jgi:type I restriction enzyme S subunit